MEDHGHGVAAGASAGTVADRYFAPNWWSRAMDASTELHNSLSAVCSNHGEHAVARAGVGEVGNTPPGLTVDGDCYFVCVAHDEPPQLRGHLYLRRVLTLLLLEVLFELVNAKNKLQSLSGHKRWQARCDPFQPNARARSRDLNLHVCFAVIDRRYFGIQRRSGPKENEGEVSPRETPMEIADILHEFERATGKFARAAVEAAVTRREEVTPELLGVLEETVDRATQVDAEGDYMAHLYAMFLLAQFRQTRAYPLVVRFASLPGDLLDSLCGDFITEDLGHTALSDL
jgi:hypothetical protein